MTGTVLILGGNGKIGTHSAHAFKAAGWNVRLYDRASGNMRNAAQGADVIVNGLNPPNYHNWAKLIPAITSQVIDAAKHSGATVIIPGNVYNFGARPGVWDENTPHRPVSKKGKIRVEMEDAYLAAGVQTIVLRAGNFIDPNRNGDVMSLIMLKSPQSGKITYPADPATQQAYCYMPDWARVAVELAEMRETLDRFEDVPLGGLAFSAHELAEQLSRKIGKTAKVGGFPWFVMRLAAPFWELARELNEMRYLWGTDHQLGTAKLKQLLPNYTSTTVDQILDDLLDDQVNPNNAMPRLSRVSV